MKGASMDVGYVRAVTRMIEVEDYDFIYHSWLKSYRASWANGTNPVRYVNKDIYYQNQKEVIAYLLNNSYTIVAHNPEDKDHIFGYIVCQPSQSNVAIVHYCFVKLPFRNWGIGSMLLEEAKNYTGHDRRYPICATHATGVFHSVLAEKYNAMFNPYMVYRSLIDEDRFSETGEHSEGWR